MRKISKSDIIPNPDDILLFACIRNESLRLPYFIEYYKKIGVDHFIIVDNGSVDGSTEFLLHQEGAHVFYTRESYSASRCGVDWLNKLINQFGVGHWTLTVDVDELLVYPYYELVGLAELTKYLDHVLAQGMPTFLLDMYSQRPIRDVDYRPGEPFVDFCKYFDVGTYHEWDSRGLPVRGGARHRLFWQDKDREKPSPVLGKIPLVKWREGLAYKASTHSIDGVNLSEMTGVLQHFKFFSDFFEVAEREASRLEHWDNAAQYNSYWETLRKHPGLSASFEGSVCFENSEQLAKLGYLKVPRQYREYVKQQTGAPVA